MAVGWRLEYKGLNSVAQFAKVSAVIADTYWYTASMK